LASATLPPAIQAKAQATTKKTEIRERCGDIGIPNLSWLIRDVPQARKILWGKSNSGGKFKN
jgi:hypothetical protein